MVKTELLQQVLPIELAATNRLEKNGSFDRVFERFGINEIHQRNRISNMVTILERKGFLTERNKSHFWGIYPEGYSLILDEQHVDTNSLVTKNKKLNRILDLYFPENGTSIFSEDAISAAGIALGVGMEMGGIRGTADLINKIAHRTGQTVKQVAQIMNPDNLFEEMDTGLKSVSKLKMGISPVGVVIAQERFNGELITFKTQDVVSPTINVSPVTVLEIFSAHVDKKV